MISWTGTRVSPPGRSWGSPVLREVDRGEIKWREMTRVFGLREWQKPIAIKVDVKGNKKIFLVDLGRRHSHHKGTKMHS